MLRRIEQLYPREPLFAANFAVREDGLASYPEDREATLRAVVHELLVEQLGTERVFDCVAPMTEAS